MAPAFGVVSGCALPFLVESVGLGAAGVAGGAVVAAPYRTPLLTIGALGLIAGAVLLTRQQLIAARCGAGGVCTPRWMRIGTLVGLIVGAALLWAGYTYV